MGHTVPLDIPGLRAGGLGDIHLGKRFLAGVPLARRGEREADIRATFAAALDEAPAYDLFVQFGDIFDAFAVPNAMVLWTSSLIATKARQHPDTLFVFLCGNHDAVRDVNLKSSFDVLAALLAHLPNVVFVTAEPFVHKGLAILPWSPFKTAAEMAQMLVDTTPGPLAGVIGHWDAEAFGQHSDNLIPTQQLSGITNRIWSGHEHLARRFERDGVLCDYIGSMLPYAHGEDATGRTYITVTLDQLQASAAEHLRDKCVRVLLRPGEAFDGEIDCLQFQTQKVETVSEPNAPLAVDVKFEEFDPDALYDSTMAEHQVPAEIVAALRQRWADLKETASV